MLLERDAWKEWQAVANNDDDKQLHHTQDGRHTAKLHWRGEKITHKKTVAAMAMEVLLIRIDTFRDRKQYLSILKAWLAELAIAHGRLITMGEFHLLFIAAEEAQNTKLLEFYATKEIDTNSKDELCVDKFIDIVGRKKVEASGCKGFLEMNILNKGLLEKVLVHEWHGDQEWLDSALSTPRTKALLAWREEAKASRRDRRKKSAQERDALKLLKKQQAEAEAAAKAAAAALKTDQESDDEDAGEEHGGENSEADDAKEEEEVGQQGSEEDEDEDEKTAQAPGVNSARPQQKQGNQQAKAKKTPSQGPTNHKQQNQKQKQGQQHQQQQQQSKKRSNSQDWKQKSKQQKRATN